MISTAEHDKVLAFRLDGHHLARRLPPGALPEAAGACGIQNTPPGAAELSLHARLTDLRPGEVKRLLEEEKTLLQVWSLRASPTVIPTRDAPVYTQGLLPEGEAEMRAFIYGVEPALEKIGIQVVEVIGLAAEALLEALDGQALTKDELGIALAERALPRLTAAQAEAWQSPSLYASGQSLGESVMRFALPVLALRGLCCHAERKGSQAYLRRTDQWLAAPLPTGARERAQAELARRYLHCYGPSTPQDFAGWAGIALKQADRAWRLLESELVEVRFNGKRAFLFGIDLPRFQSPPAPEGVRFLPPHDPYLQLRDRSTLISDRAIQRRIWRTAGSPGVILVAGQITAAWQAQKKGRRLAVRVETFISLSPAEHSLIQEEAEAISAYKGCQMAEVFFAEMKT